MRKLYINVEKTDRDRVARLICSGRDPEIAPNYIVDVVEFNVDELSFSYAVEELCERVGAPAWFYIVDKFNGDVVDPGASDGDTLLEAMWENLIA